MPKGARESPTKHEKSQGLHDGHIGVGVICSSTADGQKSCMTLRTLNYGNYGIFLIMGNAGFCPSTVSLVVLVMIML